MVDKSALKILAVDDEPFMLKLHTRLLANLGYTSVTVCEGAMRALETMDLADKPADLILPPILPFAVAFRTPKA